jgi:hypothetical protein
VGKLKLFLILFVLFALLVPSSCNAYHDNSVPQAVRLTRAAIFNLKANGDAFCTGFAVDTGIQKVLISAGHCAEALNTEQQVVAYHPLTGRNYIVKLLRYEKQWPEKDCSVWSFLGGDPLYGLSITRTIPEVGDDVYSMVGPYGMFPFLTAGTYSGITGYSDNPTNKINGMHLITALVTAEGASGSPIVNSKGQVWGVIVGGRYDLQGTALVVLIPANF